MAIDDLPSERALRQLEMERLHETPVVAAGIPKITANAISAVGALLGGNFSEAIKIFEECHKSLEEERSTFLFGWIIKDLKALNEQQKELFQLHEKYLTTDFVPLLIEADKKARQTRAKTRIRRIAEIVCAPLRIDPTPAADETEEMMRIATELTDDDVLVLRDIKRRADEYMRERGTSVFSLDLPTIKGLSGDTILGMCGKLQSLGLIATPQQYARAMRRGTSGYPPGGGFVLLVRAERFLQFAIDSDRS